MNKGFGMNYNTTVLYLAAVITTNVQLFAYKSDFFKKIRSTHLKRCVLSKTTPQQTEPNIPAKTMQSPMRPASISCPG